MTLHRFFLGGLLAFSLCAAGCLLPPRPVSLFGTAVEVYNANNKEYLVVERVLHGALAKVVVSFTWNHSGHAGTHTVKWDVYQGAKRIRAGSPHSYLFKSSPFQVALKLDTTGFAVGEYRCVLYLDGQQTTTVPLTVVRRSS